MRFMYVVMVKFGALSTAKFSSDDGVNYKAMPGGANKFADPRRFVQGDVILTADKAQVRGRLNSWLNHSQGVIEFWTESEDVAKAAHDSFGLAKRMYEPRRARSDSPM